MQDILVGAVDGVFGIKGWLKIKSFTQPIDNILKYSEWKLAIPDGSSHSVELEAKNIAGRKVTVKVAGVDDRDAALALVGAEIKVSEGSLPALEEGEFYHYQLEGLTVVNAAHQCLGVVSHVLVTGANDVLVVKPVPESVDSKERLIPYLFNKTVMAVLLDSSVIEVEWELDY